MVRFLWLEGWGEFGNGSECGPVDLQAENVSIDPVTFIYSNSPVVMSDGGYTIRFDHADDVSGPYTEAASVSEAGDESGIKAHQVARSSLKQFVKAHFSMDGGASYYFSIGVLANL